MSCPLSLYFVWCKFHAQWAGWHIYPNWLPIKVNWLQKQPSDGRQRRKLRDEVWKLWNVVDVSSVWMLHVYIILQKKTCIFWSYEANPNFIGHGSKALFVWSRVGAHVFVVIMFEPLPLGFWFALSIEQFNATLSGQQMSATSWAARGRVIPQPGDGSCLYHSLSCGLRLSHRWVGGEGRRQMSNTTDTSLICFEGHKRQYMSIISSRPIKASWSQLRGLKWGSKGLNQVQLY
jgi:hypothetical protein